jgi:hypothetical protein
MNDNFCRMVADALTEQDAKEERRKLRPWVGAVISGMCLAILFAAAKNVYGAEGTLVYRDVAGNSLTLMKEPCPLGGWFKNWQRALWVWKGEAQEACWSVQMTAQGEMVMTIDSSGDNGGIPPELFKKEVGT